MAGLISGAMAPTAATTQAASPAPAGAPPLNPILQKVESGIEAKVSPQSKKMYMSIVVASMKLAFDAKTHPLLIKGLQSSPDMVKNVSLICAGMIGTVQSESKQDANAFVPAAVLASITLMCQILQFAEQAGMLQVTDDLAARCSAATTSAVLAKFGVDKAKVQQAVDSGKAQQAAQQAPGAAQPAGVAQ